MLTKNFSRAVKDHPRQLASAPVRAGQLIYVGSVLCYDVLGRLVRGIVNAVKVAGVTVEQAFPDDPKANVALDNTNGSDGAWSGDRLDRGVRLDQVGEYYFPSVAGIPRPGGKAYLVDDDQISSLPTASTLVVGEFTQPYKAGWLVDIGKRNRPAEATVTMIVGAAAAGDQAVAVQLVDEHGDDLPLAREVSWYLAEDAAGVVRTSTPADGGVAGGANGSVSESTAGVAGMATTAADGSLDVVVSHAGAGDDFYLVVTVPWSGRRTVSSIITPTP